MSGASESVHRARLGRKSWPHQVERLRIRQTSVLSRTSDLRLLIRPFRCRRAVALIFVVLCVLFLFVFYAFSPDADQVFRTFSRPLAPDGAELVEQIRPPQPVVQRNNSIYSGPADAATGGAGGRENQITDKNTGLSSPLESPGIDPARQIDSPKTSIQRNNSFKLGTFVSLEEIQGGKPSDPAVYAMRNQVRDMMQHAWRSYASYAWGSNELRPITKSDIRPGFLGISLWGRP
ncbi:unnamed protein product [Calicophoron daubneyi]|uniref:Uncharacterized protein n=1 Tax=Calicophoron daubneyi TaxID=300641 RepID=A0AAV2T8R8_CALDB